LKKLSLSIGLILAMFIAASVHLYPQQFNKPRCENFQGRMFEKLNLTADQKDKIQQLQIEHQKAMVDLRADIKKNRLDMKELMLKGDVSRADVLNIVKEINADRDKIATARANHMMDIYELLNEQQRKIFSRMPMMRGPRWEDGRMMRGRRHMERQPDNK
jgi:Spy/CpxP family protein refolding chaperone